MEKDDLLIDYVKLLNVDVGTQTNPKEFFDAIVTLEYYSVKNDKSEFQFLKAMHEAYKLYKHSK